MEQLNLRYTINSNGSITASWDAISGAVRYHAYMYIRGKGTIYNETNLTTTSYTSRPDLDANEFYQVTVVAYGASTSLTSDGARILIPSDFYNNIPLDIPQNITAAAGPVSVDISFDKVVRASGYDILLNGTIYSITGSLSRITKTISGLTPKTNYSYAVRAKNSTKTGEYSQTRTFTTPAVSPAAPTGITKSVTQNSVTISWNPVQTATMYDIVFNG
ncbi:MAG: fibronectin type III domain-containing protein, partial [Lachnospiraceae bacterium]|nr:fibronectin type III domain-containing protein [Lachnospiraceae bacterium]